MRKIFALALLAMFLAACASEPTWQESYGAYRMVDLAQAAPISNERQVLRALTAIEATPAQRQALLAAFDTLQSAQTQLRKELAALSSQKAAQNPHSAAFLTQLEPLLQRQGQLHTQLAQQFAVFQHHSARAFSETQWAQFNAELEKAAREGGLARNPRE